MPESPLWSPTKSFKDNSNLAAYMKWLLENRGLEFSDYQTLWEWSVNYLEDFWQSLWDYFDIQYSGTYTHVLEGKQMPFYKWFDGTFINYAEHVFRKATELHPAIVYKSEATPLKEISWLDLTKEVTRLQYHLRQWGIKAGDRIVAFMPGTPEATVAFLAANSLGAIWSSCSPDFGTHSVLDRFNQIEPKVLITITAYEYNGKVHDKSNEVTEIIRGIPSLERIICVDAINTQNKYGENVFAWDDLTAPPDDYSLSFERVPFAHPIWVLYSSGTTGLPKAITHSHGGILLEQLKYGTFHNNFKAGERCFWYTTTGWMMWNYIHGSLLAGGTMVLYDGSPTYPDLMVLWKFIQEAKINHFGTSAGFILANVKKYKDPQREYDFTSLLSIGSTGSTLPPEGFEWVYQHVKNDLWLTSMSGGTDVCSAFVGGNPTWPVYKGEIQCRALGCKLEAYDDAGHPIKEEVGEMVITKPMPSMPVFFWNDPDFVRYLDSYFETYPGVWRHGDWVEVTKHEGVIIYGRSDATLNRGGIRIGTSEIYRSVDKVPEVKDSLIICIEQEGGKFWMPLFVVMQAGHALTEEIISTINHIIRNDYSPRHVPDEIIAVPDIPYTISGKKTEMPVKKVLMGQDPKRVVNAGALRNPESMAFFVRLARTSHSNL